jgi:hypothetical protein
VPPIVAYPWPSASVGEDRAVGALTSKCATERARRRRQQVEWNRPPTFCRAGRYRSGGARPCGGSRGQTDADSPSSASKAGCLPGWSSASSRHANLRRSRLGSMAFTGRRSTLARLGICAERESRAGPCLLPAWRSASKLRPGQARTGLARMRTLVRAAPVRALRRWTRTGERCSMRVLLIFCHPVEDSYNAALHRVAKAALERAGHVVDDCDLYDEGFDPVLSRARSASTITTLRSTARRSRATSSVCSRPRRWCCAFQCGTSVCLPCSRASSIALFCPA